MSSVRMTSLTAMGIPCSGPLISRLSSSRALRSTSSGSRWAHPRTAASRSRTRSRQACANASTERSPVRIRRRACVAVSSLARTIVSSFGLADVRGSIGGENPANLVGFSRDGQGEGEQQSRLLGIEIVGAQHAHRAQPGTVERDAASGARRHHDRNAGLDRGLDRLLLAGRDHARSEGGQDDSLRAHRGEGADRRAVGSGVGIGDVHARQGVQRRDIEFGVRRVAPFGAAVVAHVLAVDAAEHAEVRRPEGLQTEGRGLCRLARRLNFVVEYDEYPRPAEAGLAAARTAATRFIAASLARPLSGRCEPTITTGTLSVRLRKYALSSRDAVPWPITIP